MSMAHVNPNSPQTRAWVEYANKTEGRIQPGIWGRRTPGNNPNYSNGAKAAAARKKEKKYRQICDYLNRFSKTEPREYQLMDGFSIHTPRLYVKILRKAGYLKKAGYHKYGKALYLRVKNNTPKFDEVIG